MSKDVIDPYRLFFSIGLVSAIIGISLWILFLNNMISFYPKQAHANIMFLAFLWSFICGFLLTAVPKMTNTLPPSHLEIFLMIFFVFLQLAVNVRNQIDISVAVFGFQVVFLVAFLVRRFFVKRAIPFDGFIFIPFAFLQCFIGIVFYFTASEQPLETFYALAGQACITNLILGLGSRLIPVISRLPNALLPSEYTNSGRSMRYLTIATAVSLNLGFWGEYLYHSSWAAALKLLSILIISFYFIKLHQLPAIFTVVGYALKLGVVLLIVSNILSILSPLTIAQAHLIYIGAFLLITLMVGTRVMLAHGQQSLEYEKNSSRITTVIVSLLLAALFRYFAGVDLAGVSFTASLYLGILALCIWGHKFFRILFTNKPT